jgi:hypothetical protein
MMMYVPMPINRAYSRCNSKIAGSDVYPQALDLPPLAQEVQWSDVAAPLWSEGVNTVITITWERGSSLARLHVDEGIVRLSHRPMHTVLLFVLFWPHAYHTPIYAPAEADW